MSRWSLKGSRYRRLRALILAASDICHLCGHPGADSIDHLYPVRCFYVLSIRRSGRWGQLALHEAEQLAG
jgi:hypothetical protein